MKIWERVCQNCKQATAQTQQPATAAGLHRHLPNAEQLGCEIEQQDMSVNWIQYQTVK
jgi:hypothetical protein